MCTLTLSSKYTLQPSVNMCLYGQENDNRYEGLHPPIDMQNKFPFMLVKIEINIKFYYSSNYTEIMDGLATTIEKYIDLK